MVVSTILERNPELTFDQAVHMDKVRTHTHTRMHAHAHTHTHTHTHTLTYTLTHTHRVVFPVVAFFLSSSCDDAGADDAGFHWKCAKKTKIHVRSWRN